MNDQDRHAEPYEAADDPYDLLDDDERPICCEGVASVVVGTDLEGDQHTMGHVLFADYDDGADLATVREDVTGVRADDADPLEGVTAVFQSSEGSYHVWNLTVRDLDATAVRKLSLRDDDRHAGVGYRAEQWVMRVSAKRIVTPEDPAGGAIYKPRPRLVDVLAVDTDLPQSEPHRRLVLDSLAAAREDGGQPTAGRDAGLAAENGRWQWVGDGLPVQRYYSGTDSLKRRWADR